MDWFAAGLPMEGAVAGTVFIGKLARRDAPSVRLDDAVGNVRERAAAAGRLGPGIEQDGRVIETHAAWPLDSTS